MYEYEYKSVLGQSLFLVRTLLYFGVFSLLKIMYEGDAKEYY